MGVSNFALSDAGEKISRLMNREGIVDLLCYVHQKSQEQSSWEVIDWSILLPYASLTASRTLLQLIQACLKFTLDSEECLCKEKKWFLLATVATQAAEKMSAVWPDIYYEGYIHQFQPEPTNKIL